jgi:ferric enterobactin receptor
MKHFLQLFFISIIISGLTQLPNNALAQDNPKADTLKEVSIKSNKQIIKRKADRIIYDLQADPESRGKNVLEMMRKIPYISVDADDNISLKGNASYKVFINGKPSTMLDNNLKAILRSMPASTIQSIEVITIPPSKYDAEGLAGIINIITVKKIDDGYNGNLNVNENFPAGGPGGGGSFTVKDGKFGISGYGGASVYNSPETSNATTRTATGATPSDLIQNGSSKSNDKNAYLGTELSYEIDSLNLISGQFNAYGNRSNGSSNQASQLTNAGVLLQGYDLDNSNNGNGGGMDASLNYQLGFKADKNRLLTFSYRYSRYDNSQHSNIDVFDTVNFPTPDYKQYDHQQSSEQTIQLDYVHPVKKLNIEAGLKGIFRDNRSNFQYSSLNTDGQYELNPVFSDAYNNTQDVFGAYNSYELNLKTWSFHGGVRIENTLINADFLSTGSLVKQDYFNVIPTIAINKTLADKSSLSFGFFQRIRRPSIERLNPFVDRSNPDVEITGNPNLRPNLMNEIDAGYSLNKKVSLNIGLAYNFMKNLDLQEATFTPATNVTLFTYQNIGKASGLTTNINISYPVTKQYNTSLNANMLFLNLSGVVDGVLLQNYHTLLFLQYNNGYSFSDGWRLNADLNVIGKNPTSLQGTRNGNVSTSFGVNRELIKNKLNFSAGINNPLTKFRNNITYTYGPGFFQTSTNQEYFRSVRLSLNYSFGGLKDGIKKSKNGIRNDDVSKGGGL